MFKQNPLLISCRSHRRNIRLQCNWYSLIIRNFSVPPLYWMYISIIKSGSIATCGFRRSLSTSTGIQVAEKIFARANIRSSSLSPILIIEKKFTTLLFFRCTQWFVLLFISWEREKSDRDFACQRLFKYGSWFHSK